MRGRGNLDRVTANLERFRRTGKLLVVMLTLARYNASRVAEAVRWARPRASGIIFEHFRALGRGRGIADAVLTAVDWRDAVAAIAAAAGIDAEPEDLLPYRAFLAGAGAR